MLSSLGVTQVDLGFPGGSLGEEFDCSAGDPGLIPSQEDPLEEGMATHSSILAGEFQGQRSLIGYSSWGCKESDMTV